MLLSVKRKRLPLWYSNKIALAGWNLSHCGFSKKINRNPRNKIAAASELYTTIALTILRIFGLIKTVSENMNSLRYRIGPLMGKTWFTIMSDSLAEKQTFLFQIFSSVRPHAWSYPTKEIISPGSQSQITHHLRSNRRQIQLLYPHIGRVTGGMLAGWQTYWSIVSWENHYQRLHLSLIFSHNLFSFVLKIK